MSDRTKNALVVLFMITSALAATTPLQRAEFYVKVGTRARSVGRKLEEYGFSTAAKAAL